MFLPNEEHNESLKKVQLCDVTSDLSPPKITGAVSSFSVTVEITTQKGPHLSL